jgi:hypothetical protein
MSKPVEWKRLSNGDLRGFDARARELIGQAMDLGAVGRVSTKGHAILRAPNGMTISVSRTLASSNRARQNVEAQFARAFEGVVPPVQEERTQGSLALVPPQRLHNEPTLECGVEGCDAVFVTEGARYSHTEKEHFKCPEPGCGRAFASKVKRSGHVNMSHKVVPCGVGDCPWEGRPNALGGHRRQVHRDHVAAKKASKRPVGRPRKRRGATEDFRAAMDLLGEAYEKVLAANADAERVVQLEYDLQAARTRITQLEARLAKMRRALDE